MESLTQPSWVNKAPEDFRISKAEDVNGKEWGRKGVFQQKAKGGKGVITDNRICRFEERLDRILNYEKLDVICR